MMQLATFFQTELKIYWLLQSVRDITPDPNVESFGPNLVIAAPPAFQEPLEHAEEVGSSYVLILKLDSESYRTEFSCVQLTNCRRQ